MGAMAALRGCLWFALILLLGCGRSTVVHRDQGGYIPRDARHHNLRDVIVQRGDTLYGIAFRSGLDYRDVALWNGIRPPYTIYPGDRLHLHPHGARASPITGTRPARKIVPARGSTAPTGSGKHASTPTRKPATPQAKPKPSRAPPAPTRTVTAIAWRWPTEGTLLNRFLAGDATRQGIDIVGREGQPVRAAAAGTVVYSGAGLVGYGELIIIKHSDEWLSAYGHNRRRLVDEGAQVEAGQLIAEMGSTGASRDMLHFEIRRNGRPIDPLPLLPPR